MYWVQILGFFFAGVVLNQFGLIRNLTDVKVLSEWGILFLVKFMAFFKFPLSQFYEILCHCIRPRWTKVNVSASSCIYMAMCEKDISTYGFQNKLLILRSYWREALRLRVKGCDPKHRLRGWLWEILEQKVFEMTFVLYISNLDKLIRFKIPSGQSWSLKHSSNW